MRRTSPPIRGGRRADSDGKEYPLGAIAGGVLPLAWRHGLWWAVTPRRQAGAGPIGGHGGGARSVPRPPRVRHLGGPAMFRRTQSTLKWVRAVVSTLAALTLIVPPGTATL